MIKLPEKDSKEYIELSESMHQIHLVSWFRKAFPGVIIYSIPNGGNRHVATAVKLKAEGTLPGVPDLFIPGWNLHVEMKRAKGGKLSKNQKEMIEYLEQTCGHTVLVGHGFYDAQEKILKFAEKRKNDYGF